ncbi:hypothetical protein [Leucobacter sp. VD1]|uniref:hypothetical protein n=1 Tax=Leucobacter sp. VD1 TaxID=3080381 RepID=UPI00301898C2
MSSEEGSGALAFSLLDMQGHAQLSYSPQVSGLGGACTPELPVLAIEELDQEPLESSTELDPSGTAPVSFVYRASQLADRVVTSLSISNQQPQRSCMYYNLVQLPDGMMAFADTLQIDSAEPGPNPARTFATMDEARAFMKTEEYATLKRVLLSFRLGS